MISKYWTGSYVGGSRRVLIYCPGICLDRLRKATSNASQDSLSPGRDLNPGLTTRQRRTLNIKNIYCLLHLRLQIDTILKIYLLTEFPFYSSTVALFLLLVLPETGLSYFRN
jgi:hypothetical protein